MGHSLGTRALLARDAITAACASGLTTLELLREVAERVATVVPYDSGAWMSLDPVTLAPTGAHLVGADTAEATTALHLRFSENEVFVPDYLKLRDLARGETPAASLLQATHGEIERSARQREINAPIGITDELRAIFRINGAVWGAASVGRLEGRPAYSDDEVAFLASVGEHIANGLRLALLSAAVANDREQPAVPGLIILDDADEIESLSSEARDWIDQIPPDGTAGGELPASIYYIARHARSIAGGEHDDPRPAQARIRLRSGQWLLVRGTTLLDSTTARRRSAVFLEPASAAQLAPLLVTLYELSAREREVTEHLLHGLTTDEIAAAMYISRHTVRDHTKAIFGKFGVRSRPELTAKLATEQRLAAPR
jgi:DNA-binding CsgD family transcriptional regulator